MKVTVNTEIATYLK